MAKEKAFVCVGRGGNEATRRLREHGTWFSLSQSHYGLVSLFTSRLVVFTRLILPALSFSRAPDSLPFL